MLCLGCLLGSVLINLVRDVMGEDGAVILGVARRKGSGAGGVDGWGPMAPAPV